MNKNLTELVFIIDKSGSMHGLESDTIGGINSVIDDQKKKDGNCLVSTVMFNEHSDVVQDRVSLKEIKPLTEDDYHASGCTALIDAMGDSIRYIRKVHRIIREEDVPEHTLFVITTDGMENASHKYSSADVKKMVEEQKKAGWEFLFLGANIDSVETARNYGIDEDRSVEYINDVKGNDIKFRSVSKVVSDIRTEGKIKTDWCAELKKDTKKRKKLN